MLHGHVPREQPVKLRFFSLCKGMRCTTMLRGRLVYCFGRHARIMAPPSSSAFSGWTLLLTCWMCLTYVTILIADLRIFLLNVASPDVTAVDESASGLSTVPPYSTANSGTG